MIAFSVLARMVGEVTVGGWMGAFLRGEAGLMRRRRWWRIGLLSLASAGAAAAATVLASAVNVATGGSAPWCPAVEDQPLWWVAGATAAVAGAGLLTWQAQHLADRGLAELVPVAQRPEPWVVDRPVEVSTVATALRRRAGATVGITTAVHGAGGFGKTTVAKLVRADRRVLRRFGGRVYWVTLGRDARAPAAIAAKVNDLIARLDPQNAVTFTDPRQAGEHLAALLAAGPPRLLILDDVWYPEQEAAFPVGGRASRLITTRIRSLVVGEHVRVRVDQLTPAQARAMVTAGLPPLSEPLVAGLVAETGRWPLLLRLVNKVLADQLLTDPDANRVAEDLLGRLRRSGALRVDELTGAAGQPLDVDDPQQRQHAVAATIEASTGLLTGVERARFAELAIFAEDETVPVDLIGLLWQATGGLDMLATRALCARLDQLALLTASGTDDSGVVSLHDVVRDFLRQELGADRLVHLHRVLLHAAASELPPGPDGAGTAWWELDESARYLSDHLIEHLLAAERHDAAEALAADLRWVTARLDQSGPAAPYADLAQVDTPRCARLHRLLGQTAHLLAPTEPAGSRIDVLCSRVAHDPDWGPQVTALGLDRTAPRLTNRWPLPDLPDPALRRTLIGSASLVTAVAVAPDGTWLAAGDHDGTVRIWEVATGTARAVLTGHAGGVTAVAVAPDGTWLATGGDDRTVRIWEVATGAARAVLTGHDREVTAVAVAPDGTWLATGGDDDAVRIWNTATGTTRAVLTGHEDWVTAVAVAPDGTWLATGDHDGMVRIWDVVTGAAWAVLSGHGDWVTAMAVAPDGTWLATGGADGTVRIWDVATGTTRAVLTGHIGGVTAVAVAPDGTWLATGGGYGTVRIWDPDPGRRGARKPSPIAMMRIDQPASACTWMPDGRSILIGGPAGLYLFDFHPGTDDPLSRPGADTSARSRPARARRSAP